jgi:serine/threonine protein kinase
MSGQRKSKFIYEMSDVKPLGRGCFGDVYGVRIGDMRFAVKEAFLTNSEITEIKKKTQKEILQGKLNFPDEYKLLTLVQQLFDTGKSPNFPLIYNIAYCNSCVVGAKRLSGSCYLTFMEIASSDLWKILHWNIWNNFDTQLSVLYQLLLAVYTIHVECGIYHRDIKATNILIKQVPPGGYFKYECENRIYYVKNMGILVLLSDFGVGFSLKPMNASKHIIRNYGKRNVFYNKQTGYIEVLKQSPDLNDTLQFPPEEFCNDIQDVLRMFVGGKRTVQPNAHPEIKFISSRLKTFLLPLSTFDPSNISIYYSKYYNASQMLEVIYRFFSKTSEPKDDKEVIGSYFIN